MTNQSLQFVSKHDTGICTSCDDFLVCGLHCEDKTPVYFCEEFACTSGESHDRKRENYALPSQYEGIFVVRKPEAGRSAFIGLCRDCGKLETCAFLKPGGGTWQCECYERVA
jgi:hypothetical protein